MDEDLVVPGGYHRSPPHQDWRSIQGSLDNVVMWIPTTPIRGTGLEVVRGSHRAGLLPTVEHKMTPAVEHAGPWEAIDCDPGDVVVFSSFLVHRTSEKSDGLVRIALSTRFNNAAEPTFVERGFPTNYRYSYATALDAPTARIAAPPSDSAGVGSMRPSPTP
jgi:ectoine hydroxylase-related dioxygenase (phytanoyl-CoA dioxygenase family)